VASTTDQRSGRVATVLTPSEHQRELKVTVEKASTVVGHVLDYETGGPVAGCTVTAVFSESEESAVTEADGSFKLVGPAVGQAIRLQIVAPGYIPDGHLAHLKRSGDVADIGVIKLIHGSWRQVEPRYLDWVLEGHIESTAVIAVRPGSTAERAGVVPGAVVLKVGEKDARHLGPMSVAYLSSARGAAPPFVLQLPNGSVRAFNL
jgi:hypothetical protein